MRDFPVAYMGNYIVLTRAGDEVGVFDQGGDGAGGETWNGNTAGVDIDR